jgi:hypothetical protein
MLQQHPQHLQDSPCMHEALAQGNIDVLGTHLIQPMQDTAYQHTAYALKYKALATHLLMASQGGDVQGILP